MIKSSAIDRLLKDNPELSERRFGLPSIGKRNDGEEFNPTVQEIADAIEYYGFEVRDSDIANIPDIDIGGGNPVNYPAFPLAIEEMKKSLDSTELYKYPYTEGSDEIRKILLDYVEEIGFKNDTPYSYEDIDDKGLCVHNITFLPSTSIAFNMIIELISKPGDVILVTGPNYGLFTIRAERCGAEVEVLPLYKEDNYLVNPTNLANKIDEINESLQRVYNRRKGYVPRVVAFLNANPNNPTGKVMGKKQIKLLKEIGDICLKRGVFIIDDLVYRDLCYDEDNIALPVATIKGMFRNTISLFGLSKSYGLASLRAGFVVADEIIIRELVNRIFQGMDSSPDIVGRALVGAFNTSSRRKKVYREYFSKLRSIYVYKYNLLKALVSGIDSVDIKLKDSISKEIKDNIGNDKLYKEVIKGLPYADFSKNITPEAGFFTIIDFTKIKGMKYKDEVIRCEKDLLKFFYNTSRTRFLIGKSISWPYTNELVARVSYAVEDDKMILALTNIHKALLLLEPGEDYIIRKNERKDQAGMAKLKIDGWRTAYDKIVSSKYLNELDYDALTQRYLSSFDEYRDQVFVAVKDDELLGYSCFNTNEKTGKYDSELASLYVKENEVKRGIGHALLIETAKELYSLGKRNMIIWCFSDNINAIKFYKKHKGVEVEKKKIKVGEEEYFETCFYFDLETLLKK